MKYQRGSPLGWTTTEPVTIPFARERGVTCPRSGPEDWMNPVAADALGTAGYGRP